MSTFNIIFLIIIHLVVPPVLLFSLLKRQPHSKLDFIIDVLFTSIFIIWISLSGSWSWFSLVFRYVWPLLFILIIYPSWKKVRTLPFHVKLEKNQKLNMGISIFLSFVFATYLVFVVSSYVVPSNAIDLSLPLKDGTYYVGQGGSDSQMNYHNSHPPQQYALDIEKLNKFGLRAAGLYPDELKKYAIYGDSLYSPCNGKVLETRNNLPDLTPPNADPENATGNYISLTCDGIDATIYMAHMQEGSVAVDEGDFVKSGQKVGNVGNSGNTTEPHLHIHAEKDGIGVPILFDGKFLVRNHIVKKGSES